ncbi:MAG TPA: porin family protein [Candidatus Bathyarchaeia archaeon]|nr:porin family protein [Candidatus Bathyarchaeia archaeon]
MKKTVLVCALVLVLAVLAAAPLKAAVTFKFGGKAGLSFSNVAWSDDDGLEKMLVRPTFGAFALVKLTPMLALQPEVNYLTMGEWWNDDGDKVTETMNYLHIPVLLRLQLMKEGKFVPFALAGPYVGFLLSAKESGFDMKPFLKSTDFGLDFGAGTEFPLGKMKGLVDLRFVLGLTDNYVAPGGIVIAETLPMAIMDFHEKNRALVLTFGLIF